MNKQQEEYLIYCIAMAMAAHNHNPMSFVKDFEARIKEVYYSLGDKE